METEYNMKEWAIKKITTLQEACGLSVIFSVIFKNSQKPVQEYCTGRLDYKSEHYALWLLDTTYREMIDLLKDNIGITRILLKICNELIEEAKEHHSNFFVHDDDSLTNINDVLFIKKVILKALKK